MYGNDNFSAVEAFVRRQYNPDNDPSLDALLTIQPYAYRVSFSGLDNGETQSKTLTVAANADFVLTSPRYRAVVDDAADDVVPQVLVLLTDTGSSEQLTNDQVDISTYFGQIGRAPYMLDYPRIINGRSALSVQVTNYATATDYSYLELTFSGVLVRGYRN